jgi:polyhydroxybutyrate depolymerase
MKISLILLLMLGFQTIRAQVINSDSILIEGRYRSFHFNRPVTSLKEPSLVFVLHGSGGNGRDMMKAAAKMDGQARTENAIVVYPDGYKNFWNECRKASPAAANQENVNEEAFFQGMIDYFSKNYHVNTERVFAIGTSGGGHMVYKLGITMPGKFKALTAIIANLPDSTNFDCVGSGKAVSIMIVNGTEDKVNPYNGGEVNIGFSLGYVRSTDRTFQYWAELGGYTGKPVKQILPDTDPSDGKTIERYTYKTKGKPEVTLLKVIGGKHDYPNDIDVHTEAWDFFKRQM